MVGDPPKVGEGEALRPKGSQPKADAPQGILDANRSERSERTSDLYQA